MATLAVGFGAVGHLHQERQPFVNHVAEDAGVEHRAEVVGIGDKGVFIARPQQLVEHVAGHQGGVEVAVAGRTPFQFRVVGPERGAEVVGIYFGLLMLAKAERQIALQFGIAAQHGQRLLVGGKAVHQDQRRADLDGLAGDDVQKGQPLLDHEERLRPGEAHAGAQATVELDDYGAADGLAPDVGHARRKALGVVDRLDRADVTLGDQAVIAAKQFLVVVGEMVDKEAG